MAEQRDTVTIRAGLAALRSNTPWKILGAAHWIIRKRPFTITRHCGTPDSPPAGAVDSFMGTKESAVNLGYRAG